MNIIWKPVVGYEGIYEVNNLGTIRKATTKRPIKPSTANIYPHVTLSNNRVKKTLRVHRIVAKAFLSSITGKPHVNHINGDKQDNRVLNLEWVSQQENNNHSYHQLGNVSPMLKKRRIPFKSPCNKVKSIVDVLEFNRLNKSGLSTEVIGDRYGIAGSTVRKHLRKLRGGKYKALLSRKEDVSA